MYPFRLLACLAALSPLPAVAQEYQPINDQAAFLSLVDGKELRMGLFGIALRIAPDGTIDGSAVGFGVTGTWSWQDGYFCREMDWSGTAIPYNCQLVEARGMTQIRFTVDQGAGDSATFVVR